MYEIGFRAHDLGKFNSFKEFNEKLKEKGCPKNIQFAPTKLFTNIDQISFKDEDWANNISNEFEKNNIKVSVLGCYVNPLLTNYNERNLMLNNFKRSLEFAKYFNNSVVGTETGTDKNAINLSLNETKRLELFWDFLDKMLKVAIQNNATISIEPVASHTINNFELIDEMLDKFDCENLNLIFDPVNFLPTKNGINGLNYLDSQTQYNVFDNFLKKYHKKISTIHLKDFKYIENTKKGDLSLFDGNLNIKGFLQEITKYNLKIPLLLENVNISKISDIINNVTTM